MKSVYLIVGTPGSGKTWVCKQLEEKFDYLPHDDFPTDKTYVSAILRLLAFNDKPVLIETPFSVSQIMEPLQKHGTNIIPVFILESEEVTTKRYRDRDGVDIPQGHLTRIETYRDRARRLSAFSGTSQEVLEHLRKI